MFADVVPHLIGCPLGQWIEFVQSLTPSVKPCVQFEGVEGTAGVGALIAALPRDPRIPGGQGTPQRFNLAETAALVVTVLVETE